MPGQSKGAKRLPKCNHSSTGMLLFGGRELSRSRELYVISLAVFANARNNRTAEAFRLKYNPPFIMETEEHPHAH